MSKTQKIALAFPLSLVLLEIATYLANDMYLPGLPELAYAFNTHQDMAQYTLLVWFMGSASLQLLVGPISDRYGRRIIILVGALLFTITSAICAYTHSLPVFLAARFIQGATICTVTVAGYAAVHELFDTNTAIKVMGIMGSITILAPAFGPISGSFVLLYSSWRAIFWILAVWGLVAFVMLSMVMPETNKEKSKLHLGEIFRDYRKIICNKQFLRYTLSLCLIFVAFISWIVESPFVIVKTYARSKIEFGMIQLYVFSAFIIGTQIARKTIDTYHPDKLIHWGQMIAVVSACLLVMVSHLFEKHLYLIVSVMMINSIGTALIFGPMHRLAVEACSQPMGRRLAVSSTFSGIFGVLAILLVTLINDKTMPNLCIPISGGILASLLVYWWLGKK